MTSADLVLFSLLGGTALLLYGVRLVGEGLQRAAGTRLRHVLSTLTGNRFKALAVGAGVTAVLQSSSATTVMLVGFASAGLLSLRQTIGVILGADGERLEAVPGQRREDMPQARSRSALQSFADETDAVEKERCPAEKREENEIGRRHRGSIAGYRALSVRR